LDINQERAQILAQAVVSIYPEAKATLIAKKEYAKTLLGHEDGLWHLLLSSAATLGRSSGWDGLIGDKENYKTVTFEALTDIDRTEREDRLRSALRKGNVAYHNRKTTQLAWNYELVDAMGGPIQARQLLLDRKGKYWKLHFLQQFKGVADKYSRNIMMDLHHPEFHDVVAVDSRLTGVMKALGFTGDELPDYDSKEKFFLTAASLCVIDGKPLNGWSLDRILYNHTDDVIKALES